MKLKFSAGNIINLICYYFFLSIMLLISAYLMYSSGFYSGIIDTRYYEIVTPWCDSILANTFSLLLGIFLLFVVAFIIKKIGKYGNLILMAVVLIATSLFSIYIISFSHSIPCADQEMTLNCGREFLNKNYNSISTGYLSIYPHQIGFSIYCKWFIYFFPNNYIAAIQYANIIWNCFTIIAGYIFMGELTKNTKAKTYFLLLIAGFLPLFIYPPFVYGEMIMIAMSFLLAIFILRIIRTGRIRYLVMSIICSLILVALRMNSMIPIFACSLSLILAALKHNPLKNTIAAILIFVAGIISIPAIQGLYSAKSNLKFNEGVPMIAHIAVGLQDCICSPGWSNNWNLTTYVNSNYDEKETTRLSKENIAASIQRFKANKKYTLNFFTHKFTSQWNEPSFESFQMINYTETEHSPTYDNFYFGSWNTKLIQFMNRYLFVVYVLLFLFVLSSFWKRDLNISQLVLMIASFGGMLFHMIWEAKSRYTMPFFVMLIPYMSLAVINIEFYYNKLVQRIRRKTV